MAHVRAMPSQVTDKGVPYDVCWVDADGRKRQKRFYDEAKAQKEAGRIEQSLERGENTNPKAGRQTFDAVAEEWLATVQKARPATKAKYRRTLELHASPVFGRRRIGSITAADFGRFVESLYTTERGKPRRPAGFERILYPVRAVFGYAAEEGYVTRNPARKVGAPDADTLGQEDFEGIALTPAQVDAMAEECGRRHELGEIVVQFVALTGMRAGEVERANLGDVNPLASYLTVRGTKSRNSKDRRIDYEADLAPILHPYLEAHPRAGDPAAPLFYGRDNNGRPDPLRRFDAGTFYKRVFKPAAVKLGLPALRFHDLRHTAGSWWIEAGDSLEEASRKLGHADINFTRRTYVHQLHTRAEEGARRRAEWRAAQRAKPSNVLPFPPQAAVG